jgi:NAD-dependent SIR2 family protein deacetylase
VTDGPELYRTTVGHVSGLIVPDDGPDPILLLGAGASTKSGIPVAGDLAGLAAKWAYCERHGLSHQDPQVTRSDWLPWLQGHSWFDSTASLAQLYPRVIEQLLQPRENRREFFLEALRKRGQLSPGYFALAELAVQRRIRTILTTNFDQLIAAALHTRPELRHVELIEHPGVDLRRLSTDPTYPQAVFLHGSVAHYSDQNLEEETAHLEPVLRDALRPLLRDHPLVVVGYGGREHSVMVDLLLDGAEDAHSYARGIYWCALTDDPSDLDPLVLQLAERIGSNFQLVPIEGFDNCMEEWRRASASRAPSPRAPSGTPAPIHDMRPSEASLEDLDWNLVAERLGEYANRLGQKMPASGDRDGLVERLVDLDLAAEHKGTVVPTKAGELLFSRAEPTAVELRHEGAVIPVRGNLFSVLRQLSEMVEEINAPFRLKGPVSQDVRPYDASAVKEVLVNALAHRDHEQSVAARLNIDNGELIVTTPGGLVPPLTPDRLGEPGEKAYRNPVIADILYGTGLMDKAGSGLADARRWSRAAGGDAILEATQDNEFFVATLLARAERPDSRTGTAEPVSVERFLSNMLPVRIGTERVFLGACRESYVPDILKRHPRWSLPPFALHGGQLWTFSDLTDKSNPLVSEIYGDVRSVTVAELEDDPGAQRRLVELLNKTLVDHAESLGLIVHRRHQRIWYPSEEGRERRVTYQGRVKKSTRTVTKPLPRRRNGTRRWEHESIGYSFRRYLDSWVLHIVPGWVFTHNGVDDILRGPKVAKLATRRAARDYNPQVANHLHFWLWVLTRGQEVASVDPLVGAVSLEGRLLSYDAIDAPVPLGPPTLETVVDEDAEVAEVAEQEAA